jgi:hypothetical protein
MPVREPAIDLPAMLKLPRTELLAAGEPSGTALAVEQRRAPK